MNTKAAAIRERAQDKPLVPTKEEVEEIYLVQTSNQKIMRELEALQRKLKVESYIVMYEDEPKATIVFKFTENTCTSIVTRHINGKRAMTKKVVRGRGFDRQTSSLDGLVFYTPKYFVLADTGKRWYDQLAGAGFRVWRTF